MYIHIYIHMYIICMHTYSCIYRYVVMYVYTCKELHSSEYIQRHTPPGVSSNRGARGGKDIHIHADVHNAKLAIICVHTIVLSN